MTQRIPIAAAAAVAISGLYWLDPLFVPLAVFGPPASGLVAGRAGIGPRLVAATWFGAGLLALLSDFAINHEDVAFHAALAVFTALLAAVATTIGRATRGAASRRLEVAASPGSAPRR
jgi:hypothetical protein